MEISFATLLYRYFFYDWLFRDCRSGTWLERCAAERHNLAQAKWLPLYMKRWFVLGGLLFCIAAACELILTAPVLAAFFYVPSIASIPLNAVTFVCWVWLQSGR